MRQSVFVLGTRAQLVKVAPVLKLAKERGLRHTVWFTAQQDESIDDLIDDFGLGSRFVLPENPGKRPVIGRLLVWIPKTFYDIYHYIHGVKTWTGKSPLVVVHGDTLSTRIAAVAGHWGGGAVVHLESGLGSGRWNDPFPEEMLRRLTFREARYALCPSDDAAHRMEKYPGCIVVNTQENTLLDRVRLATRSGSPVAQERDYFVASIHRLRNIDKRDTLAQIVDEMLAATKFGDVHFILHPPTGIRLREYNLYDTLAQGPGVHVRTRMPYTDFLTLISGARGVFSDGGLNQEELSYLGVPTLLFRERSECPDGLGANIRLRSDVEGSVTDFIESGGFDALRTRSRINDDVQPSQMTVDALAKWSGLRKSSGNAAG